MKQTTAEYRHMWQSDKMITSDTAKDEGWHSYSGAILDRLESAEAIIKTATEYDAAPDGAEWEPPHPIFQLADENDKLKATTKAARELAEKWREKANIQGFGRGYSPRSYVEQCADSLIALLKDKK